MITVNTLQKMKAEGEKIAMLTAYESSFAALMDNAGVDVLLVGDSLGMAVQGRQSTLPVSLQDMCYHSLLSLAYADDVPPLHETPARPTM